MRRAVVDTNVLISAALKPNTAPRQAIRWIQRHGCFLKSLVTEKEIHRLLSKPKITNLIRDRDFFDELTKLVHASELVVITVKIQLCRDPDDDKFLELAVNGRADVIVSGDNDLLVMHPFRNIPILTPAQFLEREN